MLKVRYLGVETYQDCYKAMRSFTESRTQITADELWLLQHPAIFTLGKVAGLTHILKKTVIPIVRSDRGGQVTYHGLGQLICYCLIDLKRRHIHIRQLIDLIESSIIQLLSIYNIGAHLVDKQPGVYVNQAKIASLGLHIHKSCSYHGLCLNVAMDLTPFSYIRPCGIANLAMTQMSDLVSGLSLDIEKIARQLATIMDHQLQSITSNSHGFNQN